MRCFTFHYVTFCKSFLARIFRIDVIKKKCWACQVKQTSLAPAYPRSQNRSYCIPFDWYRSHSPLTALLHSHSTPITQPKLFLAANLITRDNESMMSDDRYKRPRFEDRDSSSECDPADTVDRHPKRQAVPDPETNAPHFPDKRQDNYSDDEVQIVLDDTSKADKTNETSLRAVVNMKDAGVIIGRAGKNVNEIREYSAARVTISDIVPGAYDRILTVSGRIEAVAKAYAKIAEKITPEQPEGESEVTIRVLVRDDRMGNIIGKGGSVIKSIQEKTGARLKALNERMERVPFHPERILTVVGQAPVIEAAISQIAEILGENSDEPSNGAHTGGYRANSRGMPSTAMSPTSSGGRNRASAANYYPVMPMNTWPGYYGGMPMMNPQFYNAYNARPSDMENGSQSQQIVIPNEMVGCIIGKGGSKINEIRQQSGSHIKIADPQGGSNERLVTITGTPQSNYFAVHMLYQRIEQEKKRMSSFVPAIKH